MFSQFYDRFLMIFLVVGLVQKWKSLLGFLKTKNVVMFLVAFKVIFLNLGWFLTIFFMCLMWGGLKIFGHFWGVQKQANL